MTPQEQKTKALLAQVANKMQRGQEQQALDDCKSILQATPACYEAYVYAGQILLKNGRVKLAIDAFKDALKYAPTHPTVWALLYQAYYRVNAAEHAEHALQKAIQYQTSGDAEAHKAIATTLAQQGRQKEAAKWYAKAVKSNPNHMQLWQNYAMHLTYLGEKQQAENAFNHILNSSHATGAEQAVAHASLSGLIKAQNTSCLAPLQQLLTRLPGQDMVSRAKLHYALGKYHEDLENWSAAFECFAAGAAAKRKTIPFKEAEDIATFAALENFYTREWMQAKKNSGYRDASPIFIIGQPRTGTTLVERILTAHSNISSAGELPYMFSIVHAMNKQPEQRIFSKSYFEKAKDIDLAELGKRYLASCVNVRGDTAHFIDKLPRNYVMLPLILAALPNAKVIHLMRDPRDVCFSVFKQLFNEAYYYSYDLSEMARHYVRYHRMMEIWRERFPNRFYDIAYENVVCNVEDCSKNLFSYLELPWQEQALRFYEQKTSVSTASAVQVREPAHTKSVGRWKNYQQQLHPAIKILQEAQLID